MKARRFLIKQRIPGYDSARMFLKMAKFAVTAYGSAMCEQGDNSYW